MALVALITQVTPFDLGMGDGERKPDINNNAAWKKAGPFEIFFGTLEFNGTYSS